MSYIDDAKLTRMFRLRTKNHTAICADLASIAQNMVRIYAWRSAADREDATSVAIIRAIEAIPDFRPGRGSAFRFFSRIVESGLLNERRRLRRRRARHEMPLHGGM
jgi:DNA-directed RNA polymerase specialized sigma24 family protein